MKLSLIPSFAVLIALTVAVAIPHPAAALDVRKDYEVYTFNGEVKIHTGTWSLLLFEYTDDDGHAACTYFGKWDGPYGAPEPTQFFLDELLRPAHLGCDENSEETFSTLLEISPKYKSSGLDKFQTSETIESMMLTEIAPSEDQEGIAFGVITFATNLPYPLLVKKSS